MPWGFGSWPPSTCLSNHRSWPRRSWRSTPSAPWWTACRVARGRREEPAGGLGADTDGVRPDPNAERAGRRVRSVGHTAQDRLREPVRISGGSLGDRPAARGTAHQERDEHLLGAEAAMAADQLGVAGIVWVEVCVLAQGDQGHIAEAVEGLVPGTPPSTPASTTSSRVATQASSP